MLPSIRLNDGSAMHITLARTFLDLRERQNDLMQQINEHLGVQTALIWA